MNHNQTEKKNALNLVLSRHVLRRGFYLLLFCVCASPFALAQRQAHASRSSGRSTASTLKPAPRRGLGTDESVTWQNNTVHDGLNSASSLVPPLELRWSRDFSASGVDTISYPLIAGGMVFVTTANTNNTNTLFALDGNTGATIWSVDVSSTHGAAFVNAAYESGKVFVVDYDGLMKAFDAASGNLLWSVNLPDQFFFTSPPTAANGIVFTGGAESGGTVYAVDETSGQVVWTMPVENGDSSSPAVVGGNVYVSYACAQSYAFNTATGAQLWHLDTCCEGGGGTTPVVHGGQVYVRDDFCDSTPGLVLDANTGNPIGGFNSDTPPAFIGDLALYFHNETLLGVDMPSGQQLWSFAGEGDLTSTPVIVNQTIYIGSNSGTLYGLNTSGQQVWSTHVGAPIPGSNEGFFSTITGLGSGDGLLIVPTSSVLFAYGPCNGRCAPAPRPRPTPAPRP